MDFDFPSSRCMAILIFWGLPFQGLSDMKLDMQLHSPTENVWIPSVAERTSYFCLVHKLIWLLWSSHIFTQLGWLILFSSDHFPRQHKNGESLPNYLFLRTFSSRTDMFSVHSLHSSRITTPWGKLSNLWTFESTLLDQGFPVEHELDAFNPPLSGTPLCRL